MSTIKCQKNNFFLQIKKQLPPKTFIQKIENKFNSGFPDLIIINEMLPLFIELKAPTKGNKFKVELSQISTHLRIKANNYVSFSWFDTLKPRLYICLKVVRSANFLRFDTLRPSPFRPKQKVS